MLLLLKTQVLGSGCGQAGTQVGAKAEQGLSRDTAPWQPWASTSHTSSHVAPPPSLQQLQVTETTSKTRATSSLLKTPSHEKI